jgi:uncharacterized DUF497 family protein
MPPVLNFEWNADKAAANVKKHSISFQEAATAFADELAVVVPDEGHSDDEPREILIGYSEHNRLLFVSFVQRAHDLVRIVSARSIMDP